jgi:hypothetical protein
MWGRLKCPNVAGGIGGAVRFPLDRFASIPRGKPRGPSPRRRRRGLRLKVSFWQKGSRLVMYIGS